MEFRPIRPTTPSYNKETRETANQSGWKVTGDKLLESFTGLPMTVKTENEEIKLEPSSSWTEFSQSQMEIKCEVEAASNNPAEVRNLKTEEEECRIHPPDENNDEDSSKFKVIFSCAECCKEFEDQQSLQEHLAQGNCCPNIKLESNENGTNRVRVDYEECGRKLSQKSSLKAHMLSHTEEKTFTCDVCGKKFKQKSEFNKHRKLHKKPFQCKKCEKGYYRRSGLKKHMTVHALNKPFHCDKCEKNFCFERSLKKHRRVHKDRLFFCVRCKKQFEQPGQLQLHLRKCEPFKCDQCKKKFRSQGSLNYHLGTHSAEKPFSCKECGKCFRKQSLVTYHMGVHTGGKPYGCDKCEARFSKQAKLKDHMTQHV